MELSEMNSEEACSDIMELELSEMNSEEACSDIMELSEMNSEEASRLLHPPPHLVTHPWKYHAFLSFRGVDTRYDFTGHLCKALRLKGITTFMDDDLRRGEDISVALLQAIEESQISIIVFSERYANSKWCLDELVKIMECKESKHQLVRPIFYKVEPSDVRKHGGSFGKALADHQSNLIDNPDKVEKWKQALTAAANLSGWTLKEQSSESKFIDDIVEEISQHVSLIEPKQKTSAWSVTYIFQVVFQCAFAAFSLYFVIFWIRGAIHVGLFDWNSFDNHEQGDMEPWVTVSLAPGADPRMIVVLCWILSLLLYCIT